MGASIVQFFKDKRKKRRIITKDNMQLDVQAITGDLLKASIAIDRLMFRKLSITFICNGLFFTIDLLYTSFMKS